MLFIEHTKLSFITLFNAFIEHLKLLFIILFNDDYRPFFNFCLTYFLMLFIEYLQLLLIILLYVIYKILINM